MSAAGLSGAAKWAAVGLLGLAAATGIARSLITPHVPTPTHPSAPALVSPGPIAVSRSDAPADAAPTPPPNTTAQAAPPGAASPAAAQPNTLKSTININTATQAELELLPGIGPALATRILDYRNQHGPFKNIADLDNVKGIGPKNLAKLTPLVRIADK